MEIPGQKIPTYEELLQDLLARVPVHNPEWTNLNPSDPGVTILELFSYLTAQLMQQCGQIPDLNRRQFLSLLGVPVQPAIPATGFVTFTAKQLPPTVVAPDLEVRAGLIPFRTTTGLDVHPIDSLICYKRPTEGEQYETVPLAEPKAGRDLPLFDLGRESIDQSLWVALLARTPEQVGEIREAMAGRSLNIGILPALPPVRRLSPWGSSPPRQGLVAEMATDEYEGPDRRPRYRRLQSVSRVNLLQEPGILQVRLPGSETFRLWEVDDDSQPIPPDLPPYLADKKMRQRLVTWIRLRAPGAGAGVSARLHWAAINADMVEQQLRVTGELLGSGTGEPNQVYTLVNRPVVPGSVRVTVGDQIWQETEELWTAGPETPLRDPSLPPGAKPAASAAEVYQVDLMTGEIRFGDGQRGARPKIHQQIRADYAYGGGKEGNLQAGQLQKAPGLPPSVKVTNPLPTWGGADSQTLEEVERQVPALLRHRDRAITMDDFQEIVLQTPGTEIGRVDILPLFHPDSPDAPSPGTVTALVIPDVPDPFSKPPEPAREFLDLIALQLDARRLITTEVVVCGPVYKPVRVAIAIEVLTGYSFPAVAEAVRQAVTRFLSPLVGGPGATGWPLRRSVRSRELLAVADRVSGVSFVTDVILTTPDGYQMGEMVLTGTELPWPEQVDVHDGSQGEASR